MADAPNRLLPPARRGGCRPLLSLALLTAALPLTGQPAPELEALVVTATRAPQRAEQLPVPVDAFTSTDLIEAPGVMVDDLLKASAAFSLFRRTGSLMANPTAQGVSLRNIGPSGAGRTLVLLDGIPLNDPFGGWVAWSKVSRLGLSGAEIVRGGGSSAWGSAALGGTIQLFTAPSDAPGDQSSEWTGRAVAEAGDARTLNGEFLTHGPTGPGQLALLGRAFTSDGFWRVPAADRGSIDRRTDQDHQLVQARWTQPVSADTTLGVTARYYRENRGNGTPLQRNQTREALVAAHAAGRFTTEADWRAAAYFQTQEFANRFTAVADERDAETPALDQYAVPADAAGMSFTSTWRSDLSTTTLGGDLRWVEGETREAYFLQEGAFTRRRAAGGEQLFAGVFGQHSRELATDWRAQLGARLDYWTNRDGRRIERDLPTSSTIRDDTFASRDGIEFSPGAGLVWSANDHLRVRAAAYRAFRVPTLNELYRPFRVGNVITEANPELAVETLDGLDLGLVLTGTRGSLALTGFINRLENPVANVTLGAGPGVVPGVGFVPEGGLGRQRRNLDAVRVRGVELTGRWRATDDIELRADYLYSDARVTDAPAIAPELEGRRLPQVPEHTVVIGTAWAPGPWRVGIQLRHVSRAFEDDANTLALASATTVDLRFSRRIGAEQRGELFLVAENLLDEEIQAGRDADGRIDLGQPRFVHGGVRWEW